MKPLTHFIPNKRDRDGNSLPRSFAYARPGISMDKDATIDLTELAASDEEAARRRYPKLKALQAMALAANAEAIRSDLLQSLTDANFKHQTEAEAVERIIEQARGDFETKHEDALELLSQAKCEFALDEGHGSGPNPLLPSDDAIAASLGFAIDGKRSRAATFLLKLAATVGAGVIFGISCGLLSGSLYLDELSSNPVPLILWALLGTSIVGLIGSCLQTLAHHVGEAMEWNSFQGGKKVSKSPWLLALATVLLGTTFVAIESLVEKLGILRALREGQSFESFSVSEGELGVISLLLALPVVCWYLTEGYSLAVTRVRQTVIEGERFKLGESIRGTEDYCEAVRAQSRASNALLKVQRFESELSGTRTKQRDGLSLAELEQIEDCEFDALAADWAAEDALLDLLQIPSRRPVKKKGSGLLAFLRRLLTFVRRQPA